MGETPVLAARVMEEFLMRKIIQEGELYYLKGSTNIFLRRDRVFRGQRGLGLLWVLECLGMVNVMRVEMGVPAVTFISEVESHFVRGGE